MFVFLFVCFFYIFEHSYFLMWGGKEVSRTEKQVKEVVKVIFFLALLNI